LGAAVNNDWIVARARADGSVTAAVVTSQASPDASLADRCRMNHLATAVVGLSQGIPFFHAGDEILRSKVRARVGSTLSKEASLFEGLDE